MPARGDTARAAQGSSRPRSTATRATSSSSPTAPGRIPARPRAARSKRCSATRSSPSSRTDSEPGNRPLPDYSGPGRCDRPGLCIVRAAAKKPPTVTALSFRVSMRGPREGRMICVPLTPSLLWRWPRSSWLRRMPTCSRSAPTARRGGSPVRTCSRSRPTDFAAQDAARSPRSRPKRRSSPIYAVADTAPHARAVPDAYAAKVAELAERFDLSPALIEAVVWQESRWQADARLAGRRARPRPADAGHRARAGRRSRRSLRQPRGRRALLARSSSTASTAMSRRRSPPTTPDPAA